MRIVPILFVLSVFVPAIAFADNTPPKPDFSSQKPLVGSWACKTVKDPDPRFVGATYALSIVPDRTKYWLVATTKWGKRYVTHDPKTLLWIETYVGYDGDYNMGTSTGWKGNVLVFKDLVNSGGDLLGAETLTMTSAKAMKMHYVAPGKASAIVSDDVCART